MAAPATDQYKAKVCIVTGGTSGIGKELVLQLAAAGAIVYICARNQKRGQDLAAELAGIGANVHFATCDVTDSAEVQKFIDYVLEHEAHIDYLFHCAGIILGGEIRDNSLEEVHKILQTNIIGMSNMVHSVYRIMAAQGYGHIVNLASAAGLFPVPLMGVYGASKFYVYGFNEALLLEARGIGVRVSTVAPGIVDTPIYDSGMYSHTDKERAKGIVKNKAFAITPEKAALIILRGTLRNKAVIFTQYYAHGTWLLYRWFPNIYRFFASRTMGPYRKRLRKP